LRKKTLILVNTGTPDSPDTSSVRRYLTEFLNDRRIIDIPWLVRKLLVNFLIVPFRAPVSAKKYSALWTENGSPLLVHQNRLVRKLQDRLKDKYQVISAMRYGNPSIDVALKEAVESKAESIVIFPLYPQYSSSTTGSVYEHVMNSVKELDTIPGLIFTGQFYSHPLYIESVANKILEYDIAAYDHVLFSYHGLPEKQVRKIHPDEDILTCTCTTQMPAHGTMCYRAASYHTTRLLAERLKLEKDKYSVSFQSRFSKNWLSPFTDTVLKELVKRGNRKVLVVAPSFTADCLETTHEIGEEYRQMFISLGGEKLDLVSSLNDSDLWVDAIIGIAGL
jgi:ferrochelatase